ncbi:MAG: response regulator transcription factor [Pseudomonadota bacterium]
MSRKLLVIEDNQDLGNLLKLHLSDAGYQVEIKVDGRAGLAAALLGGQDLIVLDLMLPGMDGLDICRRLRGAGSYAPILMLTSKSTEIDRVVGLEMGADDYLSKPFSIPELLARVKAILRRIDNMRAEKKDAVERVISAGDLIINFEKRTVVRAGVEIELTAKEFDLIAHLARHRGRVYTRSQLLDQVWGYGHDGYEHTVNSHINRLRAKIESQPQQPEYVLTVWGVGYKFSEAKG